MTVHDARIHYASWNAGEAGKPPLLLVHGFLAHSHWWDFIAPYLTERYRVFAIDLSGMGESGHRSSYSQDVWVDEIVQVANALGGGAVTLIGHSFGGARAVDACCRSPENFEKLIVIDSYLHFSDYSTRGKPYVPRGEDRIYDSLDTALSFYRLLPGQDALPFVFQHLGRNSLRLKGNGWGWKFDERNLTAPRSEVDSSRLLAQLGVPTSLVYGEHSSVATREQMARVAGLVPQCDGLVEILESQHHIMADQPLALIAALRSLA
ncbi:alpha/beta fold hydrolase [Paraburkholderia phytofirmans]|uniref:alpha/beta fold hydrolase n=1 Tax=Paraburkholderia phytofirmans TaxID=261302 RepID=UPI0038B84372